ncbi:hypothetical protein HX52_25425 [Salmonella enterica]|nr:hypothetical protein [Salmonella enterica]EDU6134601.1 hypothetical protein [Salmonella enterica subsp. enterica]EIN2214395.1 hypothetical protein [Salmonella enterica subsp. enterica serovar Newport]EBA1892408.1 hypothetical protein [Salmonella enterica]ECL5469444.1 hypothetical protein [Salmonella enterica]
MRIKNEKRETSEIINIEALKNQQKFLADDYQLKNKSVIQYVDNIDKQLDNRCKKFYILKQKSEVFKRELLRESAFYKKIMKETVGYAISDIEKNKIENNHINLEVQRLNNETQLSDEKQGGLRLLKKVRFRVIIGSGSSFIRTKK